MKHLILILLLPSLLCAQEPTVNRTWVYTHIQDGKELVTISETVKCIDSTVNIHPLLQIEFLTDTTVIVSIGKGNNHFLDIETQTILPAGDWAAWIYLSGNGKWRGKFHSLYDFNGDGEINLKDFSEFGGKAEYEGWDVERYARELKCFIQLYGKSAVYEWRE